MATFDIARISVVREAMTFCAQTVVRIIIIHAILRRRRRCNTTGKTDSVGRCSLCTTYRVV